MRGEQVDGDPVDQVRPAGGVCDARRPPTRAGSFPPQVHDAIQDPAPQGSSWECDERAGEGGEGIGNREWRMGNWSRISVGGAA